MPSISLHTFLPNGDTEPSLHQNPSAATPKVPNRLLQSRGIPLQAGYPSVSNLREHQYLRRYGSPSRVVPIGSIVSRSRRNISLLIYKEGGRRRRGQRRCDFLCNLRKL
jgi:hypothetical protein